MSKGPCHGRSIAPRTAGLGGGTTVSMLLASSTTPSAGCKCILEIEEEMSLCTFTYEG